MPLLRPTRGVLFGALLLSAACSAPDVRPGTTADERWLEGRLVAPCCWTQTLDVHESPIAADLRNEIHARLAAHEAPQAIEDDMARRYGEPIRALPRGRDPRVGMTAAVALFVLAAGAALARALRRWTRVVTPAPVAASSPERDALDDRLDDELRALDD